MGEKGKEKLGISLIVACEERMKIDYTMERLLLDSILFSLLPEMPEAKSEFPWWIHTRHRVANSLDTEPGCNQQGFLFYCYFERKVGVC